MYGKIEAVYFEKNGETHRHKSELKAKENI